MNKIKNWDELTLADNFIFQKVMLNKELCKKVLSEILEMEIADIFYPDYEKSIDIRRDSKSIRLDVYVKDEEQSVYNVEIQQSEKVHIPKRGRYYNDLIDLDLLEKGMMYDELNKSIVIFICTFDYYDKNLYKYTFTYKCNEIQELDYGDETTRIILNTKGTLGDVSEDLKDFLNCINGVFSSTEFSDKIRYEVEKVKRSEEWRREYMTLYLHEQEIKRESREEGIKEGKREGLLLGVQIMKAYNAGSSIEQLAEEFELTIDEIKTLVDAKK